MRLASRQQSKSMDQNSALQGGPTAPQLMENAGLSAAEFILQHSRKKKYSSIVVLVGPGNNGADGMVVARHLVQAHPEQVTVILYQSPKTPGEMWATQRKKLNFLHLRIGHEDEISSLEKDVLVIDALFGIGLNRDLDAKTVLLVNELNESKVDVVSLDGPSGLDCDTGNILGASVKARWTLTFNLAKPGFYLNQGPSHCGRLHVLNIGVPPSVQETEASTLFLVTKKSAKKNLPPVSDMDNKSTRGRSLIFAGSKEYSGAAVLCCRSALRSGSGYVVLAQKNPPFMALQNPDFLVMDWTRQKWQEHKFSAVAVGPGFGVNADTFKVLKELKKHKVPHVVVDADALSVCAKEDFFPLPSTWIATPHAGELGRILNVDAGKIEGDRLHYAQAAQKKMGCVVVLKGFHTVVAQAQRVFIVNSGNSALAKSGTGDVLTGMITAFLAQGLPSLRAALLGVFVHGRVADDWVARGKDPLSLLASDVIEEIPSTLGSLRL